MTDREKAIFRHGQAEMRRLASEAALKFGAGDVAAMIDSLPASDVVETVASRVLPGEFFTHMNECFLKIEEVDGSNAVIVRTGELCYFDDETVWVRDQPGGSDDEPAECCEAA